MSLNFQISLPKSGNYIFNLFSIDLGFCFGCFKKSINMPVPLGAYAACKVKENEMKISKMQNNFNEDKMFYHGKYLELSPLKYNSKLMNSIWGLYNRYSVHNFKKITDAANVASVAGSQQISGFTATAADKIPTLNKGQKSTSVLVAEWMNIWETHKH